MNASRLVTTFVLALFAAVIPARAIPCLALTDGNQLLAFDSNNPALVTSTVITGLGGYTLVGLDIRTTVQTTGPANPGVGSLWAIGNSGALYQLFVINPATGAATPIGAPLVGLSVVPGDNAWFFGFDPATDRIRFMGFLSNYEIDPNTATVVTQTDIGGFINFNGSAFNTASFGGSSQPYLVEVGGDDLRTSANISTGVVTPIGPLGIDISLPNGLDIFESTTLLAARPVATTQLFNVNRTTGAATLIGNVGGNPVIRALTIVPPSFPPTLPVTVKIKGPKKFNTTAARAKLRGTAKSDAGITRVEYRVGNKGKFKKAKGTRKWRANARLNPGVNKIIVRAIGGNDVRSRPARVRVTRVFLIDPL